MFGLYFWFILVIYASERLSVISSLSMRPRIARSSVMMSANTISFLPPQETNDELPSALYLPGLDGIGRYSLESFGNFSSAYNLHRLQVNVSDRSSFVDLGKSVFEYLKKMQAGGSGEILLIGESFGGLLASYVAARVSSSSPQLLSGCVLINPATSYDKTAYSLPLIAPLVASTGPLLPLVAIATLAIEPSQLLQGAKILGSRIDSPKTAFDELNALLDVAKELVDQLPPKTLAWRMDEYLKAGAYVMDQQYGRITVPTVILASSRDRLLPSKEEGRRLRKEMTATNVELIEFTNSGHALLDGSVDLLKIVRASRALNPPEAKPANAIDIPMPTASDMAKVDKQFGAFIKGLSPVFLSKDKEGHLVRGITNVPVGEEGGGRPVLLVGNHQLYGADISMLIREFIDEKGTLVRGLAHPMIFNGAINSNPLLGSSNAAFATATVSSGDDVVRRSEEMKELFTKFGAVEVGPGTIFSLLQSGATTLLFPGGVREAYHGKGEQYELFWPKSTDFVRMAGLFDAIIVPFGAIGIADSVEMILDSDELMNLPLFGDRIRTSGQSKPSARPGRDESLVAPLSIPKAPSRCYFLFQEPIDTRTLNIYDKDACKDMYDKVQKSVRSGIQELQSFRKKDPYRDFLPRVWYETLSQTQAPTSSLNLK